MIKEVCYSLFQKKQICAHEKITPDSIGNFCPDCGQEIILSWYILRCKCCSAKRQSNLIINSILPTEKFCSKCGSKEFVIEKQDKLNFYDYNYAVLIKEETAKISLKSKIQIWIENENSSANYLKPKLITVLK